MNTTVHASPPTESTRSAQPERDLSIRLFREDELRHMSLTERLALRIALRLILRAGSADRRVERAVRAEIRTRALAEYEAQRIRHSVVRPML